MTVGRSRCRGRSPSASSCSGRSPAPSRQLPPPAHSATSPAARRSGRVLFNASQLALSLGAAAAVLALAGHQNTLARGFRLDFAWFCVFAVAAVAAFVINGVLTCVAIALHEGTSVLVMLRRGAMPSLRTDGALLALAPCFLVIGQRSYLLLPLVLVTASFVYRSSRMALMSEHAASHDELTGLLNRRAFVERLNAWLDESSGRGQRGAIALVDLDGFKQINDQLGHHVGDCVLQEIGRRMIDEGQPGQIAARLGGDEFAVLFTKVGTPHEALARARQLHALISRGVDNVGFPLAVGCSVGVALIPALGDDRETVMHQADLAMYRAKHGHTDVELHCDASDLRGRGRLALLGDLERAVERQELLLHYQPQFDLASGDLVGVEALLRWDHPHLGMVAPDEFMPLAEHTELMGPITDYVLRHALATYANWQCQGIRLRFAINVSAHNLQDLRFADNVPRILAESGVPPEALEIEITENTVMASPERTRAVLSQLSAKGIRITLDDFGTGYSSLTNLRDLPIHAIKIDRSFVTGLADDADDRTIVRSLIELAHTLKLHVTAEGVEDDAALHLLEGFGCDSAQGFLLGRPMPEADLLDFLRREPRDLAIGAA